MSRWTNKEEKLVRELYPTSDWETILAAIKKHSPFAISARASKLGVARECEDRSKKTMSVDPIISQLRERRVALDLSRGWVSGRATIGSGNRSLVIRWETGAVCPKLEHLHRWARALGMRLVLEEIAPVKASVANHQYRDAEADALPA